LTRRDLVHTISPSRTGTDKSKWDPEELSRPEAERVVSAVFDSITEALRKGEKVSLPFGTFEGLDHTRPPLRGWFLKRVRVTYRKKRRYIRFTPAGGLLEPEAGPG
jgi:nucleoid DNA-binding protein